MKRMHVNITMPETVLKKIDKQRKDMPRSRYITRLLEQVLGIPEKERTIYD